MKKFGACQLRTWNAILRQLCHFFYFFFSHFVSFFSFFLFPHPFTFLFTRRHHVTSPISIIILFTILIIYLIALFIFSRLCSVLNLWFIGSRFRHSLLMEIRADAETSSLSRFSTCFSFSSFFRSIRFSFSISVSHTASITTCVLAFDRWILLLKIVNIEG